MYDDLINSIPTADTIKAELSENQEYQKDLKKHIGYINENIQRAVKLGKTHTCFCSYGNHEQVIKHMYLKQGYRFRSTGVIGGVWQDTEEICWE